VKTSAGILMYRVHAGVLQVLLVHPGGPLWAKKDHGAWSIPKGEVGAGEEPLDAARREFEEETGVPVDGPFLELQPVRQRGGKRVLAWAVEGTCDAAALRSNTFTLEWPPRSGQHREFPEVDRAEWFAVDAAQDRILASQGELLAELLTRLNSSGSPG
jgi:predicted NUDIX family NTP pyrophosphohydrolase